MQEQSPPVYTLSTDQFAAKCLVAAQTVRKRHSQTGSYFGITPIKLKNRKLLWPDMPAEALSQGEGQ